MLFIVPAALAEEPYILRASVLPPEAPHESQGNDDCADADPPTDPADSAARLTQPLFDTPPDPQNVHGVSPWFPTCVAFESGRPYEGGIGVPCTFGTCVTLAFDSAYAAYDVESGRYYLRAQLALDFMVLGPGAAAAQPKPGVDPLDGAALQDEDMPPTPRTMTGTTGFGAQADCESCPPWP